MKQGWRTKRLGDLYQIGSSKRVLKSQWKTEGVPFYRGREVTRLAAEGFVDNELFISESHFADLSQEYGVPKAGDIVITAIGTIGNAHLVRASDRFYFKDASVLWMKRAAEVSDVSSEFVNFWLKSPEFVDQLDRGNGATVDTLTIQKLQSLEILLPSLPEQQRIVAILYEAFAGLAIAKANAEKNLQNARALFESELHSILSDEKWERKPLGSLCSRVEYGSAAKSKGTGKVPVLRMGNVQNGRFDWTDLVYTDDEAEIEKYILKQNDVLFNRTNSPALVGKTAIYKSEMPAIFAGYLIRIIRNEELLDAEYLNYFLNSNIALNHGKSVAISSVNQANISGSKLKEYIIPVPPLSDQRAIAGRLDMISNEVKRLEIIYRQKLAALDDLKKSFLHQAFTGQLATA